MKKIRAIGRRIHKYVTGGTRLFYAAKRWCPQGKNSSNMTPIEIKRALRNLNRLLRIAQGEK